jgi:RNA polymerase sigma-70 factor (ECF subfamily)
MTTSHNRATLERLYRDYKDHVFNYIARLANDRELARDVTQQAFLKALADPAVVNLESPKAYLFTVARNTLYDEWKRKKEQPLAEGEEERVHEIPDDPMETPHERVASEELRSKVEAAIGLMRPKYRELMLLRYGEDLSIEEIAQVTGRGLSDVKVNLHRARLAFDKDFTALMYSRVARARGKCEELTTLLAPFEERELPAEQIKVVDQHLVSCKLCADDAGAMKKRRELFIALPLLPAPLALDQAIQQSLTSAAHTAGTGAVTGGATKIAAKGAAAKLAAAVSVAALLAAGGYLVMQHRAGLVPVEPVRTSTPDRPAPVEPSSLAGEPARSATEFGWRGPPVVGTFQTYSRTQSADRMTGKFYVSREGFRSEMPMPTGRLITIQNSKAGKCWYVDDAKKIYMETSVNQKTGECPSFMGEAMDANAEKSPAGGVPCEGYAKKSSLGEDTVAGRAVEKWSCSGGQGISSATQWHDRKLKFLLKEEMSNGDIMEFREVSETSFAASLLEVPMGMKRVSAEEFRKAMFGGMLPPGKTPHE